MEKEVIYCRDKKLDLQVPVVMGILNATPDSFYNKGRLSSVDELITKAIQMIGEGASIIDVGGQSTRPSSTIISAEEELKRILPVISTLHQMFPSTIISVDTYYSEVAKKSIEAGADIINDISGADFDKAIVEVAVKSNAAYICMHIQGTPQTMQDQPKYIDVCKDVYDLFEQKLHAFAQRGLKNVILDPGFGFGKNMTHNYELLRNLKSFQSLNRPLLVGLSRKSLVYKPLHTTSEEALNGTTALNILALQQGAKILRVHDVKEAKEVIILHQIYEGK